MANLVLLASELAIDPLGRSYSAMTDQEAADDINSTAKGRTRAVESITTAVLYDAIVPSEYLALSAANKGILGDILGLSEVRMQGNTRDALVSMFLAAGATTRTNLAALQTVAISRGAELGIGEVHAGDVGAARS